MQPPDETKIHITPGKRDLCKSQLIYFRGFCTVFKTLLERVQILGLYRPSDELFLLFELRSELSDGMPVSDHLYEMSQLLIHDGNDFFFVQDISNSEARLGKKNRRLNCSALRLRPSRGILLYEYEAGFIKRNAWKFLENPSRPLGCVS